MAPNASKPDALAPLSEVSQRDADVKSYHIEAIEEETSGNELQPSWQKTMLTAVVASGGRCRYEGRSGYGAAVVVVVSGGATQRTYHLYDHLYTRHPAPPRYTMSASIIPLEETSTMTAADELALTARPDQFCYADACVPGLLTKPITKDRSR